VFERFIGRFSNDLAIDLGTANTLVYTRDGRTLLSEPSVVAVQMGPGATRKVRAVGTEAKMMIGRTPGSIHAVRPLKEGVIADFEVAEELIRHFIQKAHRRSHFLRPRIVIAVPAKITEVERRAVREAARAAGAREVYLIEEPMAAAIGAGLPITEPAGNMVVDIGGGTTDVAVVSLAGIVEAQSVRAGGDHMDEAIGAYIKRKYNLLIGEATAERIKIEIGSAYPLEERTTMTVKGRDLVGGVPRTIEVGDEDVREALDEVVSAICQTTRSTLERTPPELAADIADRGIVLTGGGSLLRGLDLRLREETHLPVVLSEDPFRAVVLGCGRCLDHVELLREITIRE
jgi:rod shape-determining protein MreB and related proteins